jgi:hypothetical protein
MAHAPGTTAKMWRRAMFGYLAHGVTLINLYEFRPCLAAYTENYVDTGWGLHGSRFGQNFALEDALKASMPMTNSMAFPCSYHLSP